MAIERPVLRRQRDDSLFWCLGTLLNDTARESHLVRIQLNAPGHNPLAARGAC